MEWRAGRARGSQVEVSNILELGARLAVGLVHRSGVFRLCTSKAWVGARGGSSISVADISK